jgi:hypothetical protein
MRILLLQIICLALLLAPATFAGDPPPRLIARFDLSFFGFSGSGMYGGGEGISAPTDGTGAGFMDGFGAELGAEVRLCRWIAIDAGAIRYSPTLEVFRDMGPDTMVDSRSASVDLQLYTLGLVVTPPKWRNERARVAVGILAMRSKVLDIPSGLALSFDESPTSLGVDLRGELFISNNRRWGIGGALAFVDVDPSFIDDETGSTGSLQMSGMLFKLGLRGAW